MEISIAEPCLDDSSANFVDFDITMTSRILICRISKFFRSLSQISFYQIQMFGITFWTASYVFIFPAFFIEISTKFLLSKNSHIDGIFLSQKFHRWDEMSPRSNTYSVVLFWRDKTLLFSNEKIVALFIHILSIIFHQFYLIFD